MRQYANLRDAMNEAFQAYADDVRSGAFPSLEESYPLPADAAAELDLAPSAGGDQQVEK